MDVRPIVILSKKGQFTVYYISLFMLGLVFTSVVCIFVWEIVIGVELSYFRFIFGFYITVTVPLMLGVIILVFILAPTFLTLKSLVNVRAYNVKSKFRGIRLSYFCVWLFILTSVFGFVHILLTCADVHDTNNRLKISLRRYIYDFAQNDQNTVEQLNKLHVKFNCCGVENISSWLEPGLENWHPQMAIAVPATCCRSDYNGPCFNLGLHINYSKTDVQKSLRLRGCRKIISRYFRQSFLPILYWLAAVFVWQLILAFVVLILVQNISQQRQHAFKVSKRCVYQKRQERLRRLKRLQGGNKLKGCCVLPPKEEAVFF